MTIHGFVGPSVELLSGGGGAAAICRAEVRVHHVDADVKLAVPSIYISPCTSAVEMQKGMQGTRLA